MKKVLLIQLFVSVFSFIVFSQINYELVKEVIISKSDDLKRFQVDRSLNFVGVSNNNIVFKAGLQKKNIFNLNSYEASCIIYYNEKNRLISDTLFVKKKFMKIANIIEYENLSFYRGFYNLDSLYDKIAFEELGQGEKLLNYQDFWVKKEGKEYYLKKINEDLYNFDFKFNVDYSGQYVIFNSFISEAYRSTVKDSIITIYDFHNIVDNEPNKINFICHECINAQIIGDDLYYGKKQTYDSITDNYFFNIFKTKLSKTDFKELDVEKELIAVNSEMLIISPNGKFILAGRFFYGKWTYIIVDVINKKFQYLLGRDFVQYEYFFSPFYQKFAFATPQNIIYVNYPTSFPFSTLGKENYPFYSTSKEDSDFWLKYKLPKIE